LRPGSLGQDRVQISNAQGQSAPDKLKVSIAYRDGYMSNGTLAIYGGNAAEKARKAGQVLLDRLKRAGFTYARTNIETIGAGSVVPLSPCLAPLSPGRRGVGGEGEAPAEVLLRVTVHDQNKAAVERFTKEFAPLVTAGPPGTTGYTTGRPSVKEVFAYWPALIDRSAVQGKVTWE
jgi:hypothetical protein